LGEGSDAGGMEGRGAGDSSEAWSGHK